MINTFGLPPALQVLGWKSEYLLLLSFLLLHPQSHRAVICSASQILHRLAAPRADNQCTLSFSHGTLSVLSSSTSLSSRPSSCPWRTWMIFSIPKHAGRSSVRSSFLGMPRCAQRRSGGRRSGGVTWRTARIVWAQLNSWSYALYLYKIGCCAVSV
jgi:hypothetical protein